MIPTTQGLTRHFPGLKAVQNVDVTLHWGEVRALVGPNRAGKTTMMDAIMGHLPLWSGQVRNDGEDVGQLSHYQVLPRGIGYIPQGHLMRGLFSELTVAQNLEIGLRARGAGPDVLAEGLTLFPRLEERLKQRAETLSGAEQQMRATDRALCLRPKALLLDEPTEGLQPSMIEAIRQVIVKMRDQGVAVRLVEQRVDAVLTVADRVAFIENGRNGEALSADILRADHTLVNRYVGV